MRTLLLIIFIVCIYNSNTSYSQDNQSIKCLTYWNLNDEFDYNWTIEKGKITNTDTLIQQVMKCPISVKVIDSTRNSYKVNWQYKIPTFKGYDVNWANMIKSIPIPDIQISISPNGNFLSLDNWKDVIHYKQQLADTIEHTAVTTDKLEQNLTQSNSFLNSKQNVEIYGIQEIKQFHHFYNASFILNKTIENNEKIYVPELNDSLTIYNQYYLEEIDNSEHTYTLKAVHQTNKDEINVLLIKYITTHKLSEKEQKTLENKVHQQYDFIIKITNQYDASGWLINSSELKIFPIKENIFQFERSKIIFDA